MPSRVVWLRCVLVGVQHSAHKRAATRAGWRQRWNQNEMQKRFCYQNATEVFLQVSVKRPGFLVADSSSFLHETGASQPVPNNSPVNVQRGELTPSSPHSFSCLQSHHLFSLGLLILSCLFPAPYLAFVFSRGWGRVVKSRACAEWNWPLPAMTPRTP